MYKYILGYTTIHIDHIPVYTSIYMFISVQHVYTIIYLYILCRTTYITVLNGVAGFCGAHRDSTMKDVVDLFSKPQDSRFLFGCPDAAAADGRRGSIIHEVKLWM
jgi:hypothetical protein